MNSTAPIVAHNKYVERDEIPLNHLALPRAERFVRKVTHAEYVSPKTWMATKRGRAKWLLHALTRA